MNPATLAALSAMRRVAAVAGCRELSEKLEAYEIFRRGPQIACETGRTLSLSEGIDRAVTLPAGRILWTIEGLGHAHAEKCAGEATPWLKDAIASAPRGARVPLLCGIGMALAERRLPMLATATAAEQESAVTADIAAWHESLPPASAELLVEAQGFAARLLRPRLLAPLGALWERAGAADSFWHGAGRASYFDVRHTMPWSGPPWRGAIVASAAEIRTNVLAGLSFAVTLVTMRSPRFLERLLLDHATAGDLLPAITHGVRSAIVVWHAAAAHDPALEAWRRHEPVDEALARLWRDRVAEPCARALASDAASLLARPARLFHYRPPLPSRTSGLR